MHIEEELLNLIAIDPSYFYETLRAVHCANIVVKFLKSVCVVWHRFYLWIFSLSSKIVDGKGYLTGFSCDYEKGKPSLPIIYVDKTNT